MIPISSAYDVKVTTATSDTTANLPKLHCEVKLYKADIPGFLQIKECWLTTDPVKTASDDHLSLCTWFWFVTILVAELRPISYFTTTRTLPLMCMSRVSERYYHADTSYRCDSPRDLWFNSCQTAMLFQVCHSYSLSAAKLRM